MEHKVEIQEVTENSERLVACSCGFRAYAEGSQLLTMSAQEVAEEIASDHLLAAEFKALLGKGDHVILPKEPADRAIVGLGLVYQYSVPQLINHYTEVTKLGKSLPRLS